MCLHIFISNFMPSIIWLLIPFLPFLFWRFFYFSISLFCIFLVWVNFDHFYFLFASEGEFMFDDLMNTHLRTQMIGTNLGLFLALMEFKGQLSSIWTTWWVWITLEKACKKARKTEETNVVFSVAFAQLRFYVTTSVFFFFEWLVLSWPHLPLAGFNGPEMIHFLEFSMSLSRKIRGKNLLPKFLDLLFP